MVSIYDVEPWKLIEAVAKELEKKIQPPEWARFVKTGAHKERPPVQKNWWYIRAAAVLRTIYKDGPVGVSKLRSKYGGKRRRGVKPAKFRKASGKIIRTILQQLEAAGYVKKAEKGKGRIITPEGQSLLDKCAAGLLKGKLAEKEATKERVDVKEEPKSKEVEKKRGLAEKSKEKDVEEKEKPAKPSKKSTQRTKKKSGKK